MNTRVETNRKNKRILLIAFSHERVKLSGSTESFHGTALLR